MPGKIERICEYCKTPFLAHRSAVKYEKGKFCSRICSYAYRDTRINKICKFCQSTFKARRDYVQRGDGQFCSRKCKDGFKRQRVTRDCQNCGNKFYVFASEVRRGNGKFCSKKCFDESQRKTVETPCNYCGHMTQTIPSKDRKFCSKVCRSLWMKENIKGEAHPSWRGGKQNYGPDWYDQRKKALKRDNYTCRHCGKAFKFYLDVHHIIPLREFGYIPGQNDKYKQANALDNLLTLCRSCHRRAESSVTLN